MEADLLPVTVPLWEYVRDTPERALLLVISFVAVAWLIFTALYTRRVLRQARARGNRMTGRQRQQWLKHHRADVVYLAFLNDHEKGNITLEELNDTMRIYGASMRLPDLKTRRRLGMADVPRQLHRGKHVMDTCSKSHLEQVKKNINFRLSNFNFWKLLYQPSKIPGPIPGEDYKPPTKVVIKKGALLNRVKK